MIDVEDKSWLSQVFGCSQTSGAVGDPKSKFVYVVQRNQHEHLEEIVKSFNEVARTVTPKILPYNRTQETLKKIKKIWICSFDIENRYIPLMPRIKLTNPEDNAMSKAGNIIYKPETGTFEYRFFPTPRSGKEVRSINKLLIKWFEKLNNDQINASPINYIPHDHDLDKFTSELLLEKFSDFIGRLELDSDEYALFIREGCEMSQNQRKTKCEHTHHEEF